MAFQDDIESKDTDDLLNKLRHGNNRICYVCNKVVKKAVVWHDGYLNGHLLKRDVLDNDKQVVNQEKDVLLAVLVMHPVCATTLGQRLISDGYANRNKE